MKIELNKEELKKLDPEIEAMQTSSGCFALLCSTLVMMVISTFSRGIVLWCSWEWFIVPFGVIQIGFMWAMGLSFMAGILCRSNTKPATINKKIEENAIGFIMNATLNSIGSYSAALFAAWIIHKLM